MSKEQIAILISLGVLIISVLTFIVNNIKTTAEWAQFKGMVKEKLDRLQITLDKQEDRWLKDTSALYDEIDNKIKDHETRYHLNDR